MSFESRWNRVSSIIETALNCPPTERASFVAQACAGEASLHADVSSLLSLSDAQSVLGSSVTRAAFTVDDGAHFSTPVDAANLEGRVISHYRLDERLGAGGMGVVYRASDLALGRNAALKILPEGLSDNLRKRLLQEADACARLQHPAIATYFDAGENDGAAFIAMELVQGETLRDRLRRGELPMGEAVAITRCLLEALAHAHGAGILHRDIKPENVILTGTKSAKLLDFGLAKHLHESADPNRDAGLTGRAIVGTIGYMSPEQIRGGSLDARSDVFQVGVVLYEMLAGAPPFSASTSTSLLAAVLSQDPPAIATPGVRAELGALVRSALARDPAARPPTAAAFLRALDAIGEEEWLPDLPNTLAIVDFENLFGQNADDWIGSGIAESTGADLARTDGIQIVLRDKVLQAIPKLNSATTGSRAVELGLLLGCRWVLSGAYRKQESGVNVSTHLVDVASGRVIASAEYDGSLAEIFTIQDRLAAMARESLNVARTALPLLRPKLSAYECCTRAQRLFRRLEKGTLDQSLELFQRAVDLDSRYAPALTGLASVHAMKFTYTSETAVLDRAIAHARAAIDVDPTSAEPYIWLGYALTRYDRLAESDTELARGRELDDTSFWCFYFGGNVVHQLGRNEEALRLIRRAVQLEPKASYTWCALGSLHLALGNVSEALWSFEQSRRVNGLPDASPFPDAGGYIAECLRVLGRLAEARDQCMAGLEKIEQSDHMYRDTFRVFTLVELGVIAAEQQDSAAARTAFHQAIAHVKGRPRTLAGGSLVVRALAGLAVVDRDRGLYDEARSRFETRTQLDFSFMYLCDEERTRAALERAGDTLGVDRGA